MVTRKELQAAYELAFYPPRLHAVWRGVEQGSFPNTAELLNILRMALTLLGELPDSGRPSQRALRRLARYQADARAFGTPTCLRNLYRRIGGNEPMPSGAMPAWMVRDIGLPAFCHGQRAQQQGIRPAQSSHTRTRK